MMYVSEETWWLIEINNREWNENKACEVEETRDAMQRGKAIGKATFVSVGNLAAILN